jgi:hypothetical protein
MVSGLANTGRDTIEHWDVDYYYAQYNVVTDTKVSAGVITEVDAAGMSCVSISVDDLRSQLDHHSPCYLCLAVLNWLWWS